MAKRKIIRFIEEKCDGCGDCIPECPEGAIKIIDGKARLISDLFCDGLGACIGHCPREAIEVEEREAEEYDENKVMSNIVKQGKNVIIAHLDHLKDHKQDKFYKIALDYLKSNNIPVPEDEKPAQHQMHSGGCPGSKTMDLREDKKPNQTASAKTKNEGVCELQNWPIQMTLLSPFAPYLDNADLLVAADCVPFAYPNFHQDFLKGKILLIGCPKLDDLDSYQEKLSQIIQRNNIKSITYMHMEVPCCSGLIGVIEDAISKSGKTVPFKDITITIGGTIG